MCLDRAISLYRELYPNRALDLMNSLQCDKRGLVIVDTGVCYVTANAIQEHLSEMHDIDVSMFFVWHHDGAGTHRLCHAGIQHNGLYYDTYNPDGVADPKEMHFLRTSKGYYVADTTELISRSLQAAGIPRNSPYVNQLPQTLRELSYV